MKPFTKIAIHSYNLKKILFLVIFLSFLFTEQTYANEHSQLWATFNLNGSCPAYKNWLYLAEMQTRWVAQNQPYEETTLSGGLGYTLLPQTSLWLGGMWVSSNQVSNHPDEYRPWQQIIWQPLQHPYINLTNRTRIEERERENDWGIRFRQRAALKFSNFLPKISPLVSDEVFINLKQASWTRRNKTLSQNRLFLGLQVPLAKAVNLDAGYLHRSRFSQTQTIVDHVLMLTVTINTDKLL